MKKRLLLGMMLLLSLSATLAQNNFLTGEDFRNIRGNWVNPVTNEWEYGLYEQFAVYRSDFWNYKSINRSQQNIIVELEKAGETLRFAFRPDSQNRLSIRRGNGKSISYIRKTKEFRPYPKEEKAENLPCVGLCPDTAIVRGYLRGYNELKEGDKERYGHDRFYCSVLEFGGSGERIITAPIDSLGRFVIKIPLLAPQEVYLDWGRLMQMAMLAPGGTTMVYADMNDLIYKGENTEDAFLAFLNQPKDIVFMGDNARLMNEAQVLPMIPMPNPDQQFANRFKTDMELIKLVEEYFGEREKKMVDEMLVKYPTLSARTLGWKKDHDRAFQAFLLMQYREKIYWKQRTRFDSPDYIAYLQRTFPVEDPGMYLAYRSYHEYIDHYIGYYENINDVVEVTPYSLSRISGRVWPEELRYDKGDSPLLRLKRSMVMIDSLFTAPLMKDILVADACVKEMNLMKLPCRKPVMDYLKGRMQTPALLAEIEQLNRQYAAEEQAASFDATSIKKADTLSEDASKEELFGTLLASHPGRIVCMQIWNYGTRVQAPLLDEMKAAAEFAGQVSAQGDVDFIFLTDGELSEEDWISYIKRSGFSGKNIEHYLLPKSVMTMLTVELQMGGYPMQLLFGGGVDPLKKLKGNFNAAVLSENLEMVRRQLARDYSIREDGLEASAAEVTVEEDPLVVPTSASANQCQPGYDIDKALDRDMGGESFFHSPWYGATKLPVVMEFCFDGKGKPAERIDYFTYYTRSGNGNFGKFKLYVATKKQPDYTLYGEYDFGESNQASTIRFKDGLRQVRKIKFEVLSGMEGYVSCAEMEFRRHGESKQEAQLLSVFTDLSCSELKPKVKKSKIEALPPYFSIIARKLQKGNYEREFRIYDYPAYSDPDVWAQKLMTRKYGRLDNATGIYANMGEEVVVLVGDTHGQEISMLSVPDSGPYGDSYPLHEGVNKLKIKNDGLLYVMYHTDLTSPTALPVRIHIPMGSGVVNGYFDVAAHRTNEEYARLLKQATWKYFNIKGKNIMMTLHTSRLREFVPDSILPTLDLWERVAKWNFELMGLEDIRPKQMNNRLCAMSNEEGYMSATDYYTQFHENTLYKILVPATMLADKDNMWGPAHEIGHINQGAINWVGCTESSNNLFANYVTYKLGKFASRGSGLTEMNRLRLAHDTPYVLFEAQYQGENTEMHIRMNWQLFTYFHRIGIKPDFFPRLFSLMREHGCEWTEPGCSQMNYVKYACQAAGLDLTGFFEFWGFFRPVNQVVEQYGQWNFVLTQEMIDETRRWIKEQNYPKPRHVIQYIEDRNQDDPGNIDKVGDVGKWTQFRDNRMITKPVSYVREGNAFFIKDGEEAVAFEVRENGVLRYFSNFLRFTLPDGVWKESGMQVYAVQADGKRIEIKEVVK